MLQHPKGNAWDQGKMLYSQCIDLLCRRVELDPRISPDRLAIRGLEQEAKVPCGSVLNVLKGVGWNL